MLFSRTRSLTVPAEYLPYICSHVGDFDGKLEESSRPDEDHYELRSCGPEDDSHSCVSGPPVTGGRRCSFLRLTELKRCRLEHSPEKAHSLPGSSCTMLRPPSRSASYPIWELKMKQARKA